MNFKKILIAILVFTAGSLSQASEDAEIKAMMEENNREAYESASKGMTEAEKAKLKIAMDEVKKLQERVMKMSPEELKREQDKADQAMRSPENDAKMKKSFENMSAEDKKMFEKMMKNLKDEMKDISK